MRHNRRSVMMRTSSLYCFSPGCMTLRLVRFTYSMTALYQRSLGYLCCRPHAHQVLLQSRQQCRVFVPFAPARGFSSPYDTGPKPGPPKDASDHGGQVLTVDKSGFYEGIARAVPREKRKSPMTPLGQLMISALKEKPYLLLADYMDLCLIHPEHGYYTRTDTEKIGKKGDFVTAPEITQMFGELLGIWMVATWSNLKEPPAIRVVDIGPGRGSLMQDVLRVACQLPMFAKAIKSVHMIEISEKLRATQRENLGAVEDPKGRRESERRETDWVPALRGKEPRSEQWILPGLKLKGAEDRSIDLPIEWHDDLRYVPFESPLFFVAQELFDAFPGHQFEYTENGWRERAVALDEDPDTPHHFKIVTMESESLPCRLLQEQIKTLPKDPAIGQGYEVCPLSFQVIQQIGERVARTGGAALIVDYGEEYAQEDTLRGYKRHAHVDPMSEPGDVDLSMDVDFAGLKDALAANEEVAVYGPMQQGEFLGRMGIETRLQTLLEAGGLEERQQANLYDSYRRLCDPEQMGRKYKVMAIVSKKKHQGPAVPWDNVEEGEPGKGGKEAQQGIHREGREEKMG